MSVETARLNLQVDSDDAQTNLRAFANETDKTKTKTTALNKVMRDVSRVFSLVGVSIAKSNLAMVQASSGTTSADKANIKLAQGALRAAEAAHKQAVSMKELDAAAKGAQKTLQTLNVEQQKAVKMTGTTNTRGAAQANRFNSANFLAQFQDIAVTAGMGMNPMLIAMQQGTQLQYILAQSNAPLKDFVAGLKSAFNMTGILTIGLTGLVAAGIQMVDWVSVGKTSLNALASVFEFVANNAEVFATAIGVVGTTLIAFNAKAIVVTIANLGKMGASAIAAGAKMAAGWAMAMGPVGWIITGVATLTTAFIAFGDKIESFFGVNFSDVIKKAVNLFIGSFIAGFEAVYEGAKWLWNKVLDLFNKGNGVSGSFMDSLNKGVNDALNRDYLKKLDDVTGNRFSSAADKTMAGLKAGATAVADKFRTWSEHLGESEKKSKKIKDYWADIVKDANQSISALQLEASLLGKSEYESVYEKTLASLKEQAEGHDITLDVDKINQLETLAKRTADVTVETNKLTEAYKESKSMFKGFFTDMRQGLLEGETAWQSFGNAVMNVLNKIIDKLMDKSTDILFDSLWNFGRAYMGASLTPGSTSASGAPFSSVATTTTDYRLASLGYAKGGVFTNGVYDTPTTFKFAKGGRFGVMGEAGPEAVMPLRRGPDGSLGVKADSSVSSPVIVNVINNSNAQARTEQRQTSQGVELDVIIDNLVAEKMAKNGTASNSALKSFNNQSLVMR